MSSNAVRLLDADSRLVESAAFLVRTLATNPTPCFIWHQILADQFMPTDAKCFPSIDNGWIVWVFCPKNHLQMRRPHASLDAANVVNLIPINVPVSQFGRNPVCVINLSRPRSVADLPVSGLRFPSTPQPASVRFLDVSPKPLNQQCIHNANGIIRCGIGVVTITGI